MTVPVDPFLRRHLPEAVRLNVYVWMENMMEICERWATSSESEDEINECRDDVLNLVSFELDEWFEDFATATAEDLGQLVQEEWEGSGKKTPRPRWAEFAGAESLLADDDDELDDEFRDELLHAMLYEVKHWLGNIEVVPAPGQDRFYRDSLDDQIVEPHWPVVQWRDDDRNLTTGDEDREMLPPGRRLNSSMKAIKNRLMR